MELWPHQQRGIDETLAAIARGERRVCLTSPTGGGKTAIASELIRSYLEADRKVVLYTNRRMLIDQTSRVLEAAGHSHGIRAAGYEDDRHRDLQVSSIQTEHSRVLKRGQWKLHDAELVIVDEAHLQTGPTARKILDAHHEAGAAYVGLTATPIDLGGMYDHLVVAGTTAELRNCGALVRCLHYGPDEPDLRHIKKLAVGEDLSESQNRKAIMTPTIWARVYEWWKKLNPDGRPTILFAPGVAESIWFAEHFNEHGITAAHIDGQEVWLNGKIERTSREARADVLAGSKDGTVRVLCNRFVLREGIDAPWLCHGIFATVFGSLQSYLQSGGRLLRAYPGIDSVTLQDHGGNWWRHGSLNADREWRLEYTAGMVSGLRQESLRGKKCRFCGHMPLLCKICPRCQKTNEVEGARCPECAQILSGYKCPCGFELKVGKKSRPVVQLDGTLKEMHGDVFRPRRLSQRPDGPKIWERMYYRSRTDKGKRSFRAAAALFAAENNWGWPSPAWPLMPTNELDWFRNVADVPRERLTR